MSAPAKLRWLQTFGNETFYRPGVDEHVHRLWLFRTLSVTLCDVDALDTGLLAKARPLFA